MTMLFEQKAPGIMALLMQDFALTVEDAAAPLGNFGEESGGFALLQEQNPIGGGAGGFGWAQWTGPRRVQFFAYCSRAKLDPKSDQANYGFLFTELKGAYAHVLDKVRSVVGIAAKVVAFMNGYEMPNAAYAHVGVRISYANRAIAAYSAAPKPITPLFATPGVPSPVVPPAPSLSTGTIQGTISMSNPLIDKLRDFVDQVDNAVRKVDAEIDAVENFPFISGMLGPLGKLVDTIESAADGLRSTVDQLDPLVPPTPAPAPKK